MVKINWNLKNRKSDNDVTYCMYMYALLFSIDSQHNAMVVKKIQQEIGNSFSAAVRSMFIH